MAKPKLALIPSGVAEDKLFSVLPSNGDGDFDFTRGSTATRVNAQGLIETVSGNTPRLNYPLLDGKVVGCPHHILEPQSRNLQTYSSDLASAYVPTEITQTSNYGISPDGTKTSTRVVLDNLSTSRSVETLTGVLVNGTTYTFSCYYKGVKGETTYMYFLSSTGGTTISKQILFNGQWQRESITFTAGSASNYTYIIDTRQGSSTATDFEVWGGQIEAQSYPTSYIPNLTTGSTTRLAETCNGAGTSDTFNDSEGVLMAEISALADDGTNRFISLTDGSNDNRVLFGYRSSSNQVFARIEGNNSTSVDLTNVVNDTKIVIKLAIYYDSSFNYKMYLNGFLVDSAIGTDSIIGLDTFDFTNATGTENFYGNTKQIQYFDTTDIDLEQLTSWVSFSDMANGQLYTIE